MSSFVTGKVTGYFVILYYINSRILSIPLVEIRKNTQNADCVLDSFHKTGYFTGYYTG